MSDLAMWNLVVAFLLPNVIALVQQPRFSKEVRTLLTAVFCIVAGLGTSYFNGDFEAQSIISSILLIGVSAIVFYSNFWKKLGVPQKIEAVTSPSSSHDDDAPIVVESSGRVVRSKDESGSASLYYLIGVVVLGILVVYLARLVF